MVRTLHKTHLFVHQHPIKRPEFELELELAAPAVAAEGLLPVHAQHVKDRRQVVLVFALVPACDVCV